MRGIVRSGAGVILLLVIMFTGSLVLWVGTPVLWLWIGSQIQGATDSLGTAICTMFVGAIVTIALLALLLAKLSDVYRANVMARGRDDPGHLALEGVLVISAATALVGFGAWFFLLSGASPIPLGFQM